MKTDLISLTVAASLTLTGCGGGSGSPSGTPAPDTAALTPSPIVATPNPTSLQDTVSSAPYPVGSTELAAYTELNNARAAYGVGKVSASANLSTAALNHAKYLDARFRAGDYAAGHTEDPAFANFTGATPADRVAFAKYAAISSGEDLSVIIAVDGVLSEPGTVAVETLLSGPYHRFSLFDGSRDVGFGHTEIRITGTGGVQHTVVANFGVAQGNQPQAPADDWIGVWPLDKATDVMYGFAGESPNPIPANNGRCAGYPVSLQANAGVTLTTTTFTLVEAATGAPVNVQLSTSATDVNPAYARANSAYIIPFKPLKLATRYMAHFVGAQNGVAIDKTWSFDTRADNTKMVHGCDPS
jgi:uncharacterized protein YkwD